MQSKTGKELTSGSLINYKLKVHQIPISWQSRIEEWNPPNHFVDSQIKGPYHLWHHTHIFIAYSKGTLMIDKVRYSLPGGFFGDLLASRFVRNDLEKIFNYRKKIIEKEFTHPKQQF